MPGARSIHRPDREWVGAPDHRAGRRSFVLGWREIVVVSPGTSENGGSAQRLTAYPSDPLAQPPIQRSKVIVASPDLYHSQRWTAPDAEPLAADPSLAGSS